ncbi:DnaA regulatory inactivator Hda [Microbulbifer flavimaris]|uniref:DnaA regulatory inactivator Hda n=1 Tax=Microbulbifer flavimaris TaxID=1781068 RepID=A0ABX4HY72_9GAMM|nr:MULTISPECIES: DnaA regulatory inactivator Hda [Microbulbifer]KUJ81609.1 DnaA regulatory inactivator Hda [Microbulbifer sp. ZGT114]PCO04518.1 DnaA regulatory inactivator Hda [Microbulbifer flavimaris]
MSSNQGAPQQLPLGVSLRDDATFDNFYLSGEDANRQVVEALQAFACGQSPEQVLYLWGEPGSGVSHLLQSACQSAEEAARTFQYLPLKDLMGMDPSVMLDGLEQLELVCIDDLHLVEGQPRWQEALFHLYNRVRDSGGQLLLGARKPPRGLELDLADLHSRLQWGLTFQLQALNDSDKLAALRRRSRLRGFDLPEDVAQYILHRSPRDTRALFQCLETLDRASLMAKRKITIPFVKEVLGI